MTRLFTIDAAIMSLLAYDDCTFSIPSGWKILDPESLKADASLITCTSSIPGVSLANFLVGANYRILVFLNEANKHIVIANRGSAHYANWLEDNSAIVFSLIPKLYELSSSIAKKIHEKFPGYSISHTGHSLGGVVAELVALENGEEAKVFDVPGLKEIVDKLAFRISSLNKADITVYQSAANIINSFGCHIEGIKVKSIKHCPEVEKEIEGSLRAFLDAFKVKPIYSLLVSASPLLRTTEFARYTSAAHSMLNITKSIQLMSIESYRVAPGDSLSKIAQSRYGFASEWKRLYEENKKAIGQDPNKINVGTELTLKLPSPRV